ncbi:hypothetical protein ILP92_03275 [Maribius pontilimi]|uniref:PEP-CTERM protein-sorting domain-containing protein n=1 Tax=Palleronia pontilimi TaxID=1964209 RepID=A0A934I7A1_9RHOB|nr:hypothetical protein [Palleronia pontilimi]MBJ3761769.1 hypothetical protein [Palleronia pontilimi]
MIVLAGIALGIAWGITTARKRGGNRKDMAQYAAGAGIAGALLGLIATLVVERLLA